MGTMSNYPSGFSSGLLLKNKHVQDTPPGRVFWVGNNATLLKGEKGALDDNANDMGGTFLRPFATLDYAVGQCVANRGDIIYVRPNHTETVSVADAIDFDVAGISVIGLGNGSNRPRLDYTVAAGEVAIGADNVLLENLNFHANVTAVLIAVDIEDGVDFATIRGCLFDVEATGTDEFNNAIRLTNNNTGCVIEDCYMDMGIGGAVRAIFLDADTDNTVIRRNFIQGDYSTANIGGDTTLSTNLLIEDNILVNGSADDLGTLEVIELLTGTTAYIRDNLCVCNVATPDLSIVADTAILSGNRYSETITGGDEPLYAEKLPDDANNFIGVDDSNNVAATTNVAANRDGSILERLESIVANQEDDVATNYIGIDDANNVAATTNVAANRDGSILERLEHLLNPNGTGSIVYVTKSLTSSAVLTTGVDVTGVSAGGALEMIKCAVMTDATGLAAGTLFTMETNNANGKAVFFTEAVADLGVNATETIAGDDAGTLDAGSFLPIVESGKKIIAKCTGTNCTGTGVAVVHMVFRALADTATIAAA